MCVENNLGWFGKSVGLGWDCLFWKKSVSPSRCWKCLEAPRTLPKQQQQRGMLVQDAATACCPGTRARWTPGATTGLAATTAADWRCRRTPPGTGNRRARPPSEGTGGWREQARTEREGLTKKSTAKTYRRPAAAKAASSQVKKSLLSNLAVTLTSLCLHHWHWLSRTYVQRRKDGCGHVGSSKNDVNVGRNIDSKFYAHCHNQNKRNRKVYVKQGIPWLKKAKPFTPKIWRHLCATLWQMPDSKQAGTF